MTYWESPRLNRLNASMDARAKTVNPRKFESGLLHTAAKTGPQPTYNPTMPGSFYRHYAMSPNPS